ncbi:hypothetical protein [Paracoccus sp. (in: a-proteobacteria)]
MNANGLMSMLIRRLMSWGMDKGIDLYARRSGGTDADGKPRPAAQKQARAAREAAKRARQAARITRRLR